MSHSAHLPSAMCATLGNSLASLSLHGKEKVSSGNMKKILNKCQAPASPHPVPILALRRSLHHASNSALVMWTAEGSACADRTLKD